MPTITSTDTSNRTTGGQNPPYSQPVPANLFSLNDQHDCASVHRWLIDNFLKRTGMFEKYQSLETQQSSHVIYQSAVIPELSQHNK